MKFFIVFALVSTFVLAVSGQNQKCDELAKEAEKGARKLLLTDEGATLPQTMEALNEHCNEGKKMYNLLKEYKTCLKPFPQQLLTTVTGSVGKVLKKNCAEQTNKEKVLKALQCGDNQKLKEAQKCMVGVMDAVTLLSESKGNRATILPQACCISHITHKCIYDKIGEQTCSDPTVSIKEHFDEMIGIVTKDVMELACDSYKTLKDCEAKIPNEMAALKKAIFTDKSTIDPNRSLINPILAIGEKIA